MPTHEVIVNRDSTVQEVRKHYLNNCCHGYHDITLSVSSSCVVLFNHGGNNWLTKLAIMCVYV